MGAIFKVNLIATRYVVTGAGDQHRAFVAGKAGSALAVGGRGPRLPDRGRAEHVAEVGQGGQSAAEEEEEEEGTAGDLDVVEQGWQFNRI